MPLTPKTLANRVSQYCLIMDDRFENMDNWNYEVQMNGFGYVASPPFDRLLTGIIPWNLSRVLHPPGRE